MECIIAMHSATLAQKAFRTLSTSGISCEKVSIDPSITRRGCSYGISLPCRSVAEAETILNRKRIAYGDIIGIS